MFWFYRKKPIEVLSDADMEANIVFLLQVLVNYARSAKEAEEVSKQVIVTLN